MAEIHINLDAKCKRCGKGGAVNQTGICMACVATGMKDGEFDHIIDKLKSGIVTTRNPRAGR